MEQRRGRNPYAFRGQRKDVMRDITHNYEQEVMYKSSKQLTCNLEDYSVPLLSLFSISLALSFLAKFTLNHGKSQQLRELYLLVVLC